MKIQLVVKINLTEMFVKTLPNKFYIPNNTYITLPNGKTAFIESVQLNLIHNTLTYTTFLQGNFSGSVEEKALWKKYGFSYFK